MKTKVKPRHKAIASVTLPTLLSDKWIKEVKTALKHPSFKIVPPKKPVEEVRCIRVPNDKYFHQWEKDKYLSSNQLVNYQVYRCLIDSNQ